MSTSIPSQASTSASQLCGYCHQKPKFAGHSYCSKTCASQAATLCNHCHKKPKFQGFDYCGKNCAAQGQANPLPGAKATTRNVGLGTAINATQQSSGFAGRRGASTTSQQTQQGAGQIDPVQLAKLVAQHIPQVTQALMGPNNGGQPAGGLGSAFAGQSMPQAQQSNNGGTYSIPSSGAHPATQRKSHSSTGNGQQTSDNLECLIPGCRKPIHTDAKGVKMSEYCSLRHREEAVTSGLREPCIMCLSYPQSEMDYFCSRACREESMNKFIDLDKEEDSDVDAVRSESE